jgi:hypothetical protein
MIGLTILAIKNVLVCLSCRFILSSEGEKFVVCGLWFVVCGLWFMVYGFMTTEVSDL